jgi:dihydrofolate reductase
MKVILLYVASLDGKTTKWEQDNIHEWTSQEDAQYFQEMRDNSKLIVMGSTTFNLVKPTPTEGILRVVMTKSPNTYNADAIPGQLEFTDETPTQLVTRMKHQGYDQLTLVSGEQLTTAFFQEKLIDEIWLTLEPKLFGQGNGIVEQGKFDISLQLMTSKQLNKQGTLLLQYTVLK